MIADVDAIVVDAICRWTERLVMPNSPPRVNVRLVFGTAALADAVGKELSSRSSERAWYLVRSSASPDAVRLRHGRPASLAPPAGVTARTPVIYVLFWLPGERGHERNAQSLADIRAVDVPEVMGSCADLVLPAEESIQARCDEAAQAWPQEKDQHRAAYHLRAAWQAMLTCLRERYGGRQRSIPLVSSIENYARYLLAATIPDPEWRTITPAARPGALVRRWGEALPELSMFRFPAIANALGLQVDPARSPPGGKKDPTPGWIDTMENILAENIECAMDFASLHDTVAGNSTIENRVGQLAQQIQLSETDQNAAKEALIRFCHDGDPTALGKVDWLFWADRTTRRSASLGLKGLLIARGRRRPGENPIDKAAAETLASLKPLVSGNEEAIAGLEQTLESWGHAVARDNRAASDVAGAMRAIASGAVPAGITDPNVRAAFALVIASAERKPEVFDNLAGRWAKLAEKQDPAAIRSPTLLLGLAQLFAQRLRDGRRDGARRHLGKEGEDTIVLTLDGKAGEDTTSIEISSTDWRSDALDKLHRWLSSSAVLRTLAADEGDEDEDEDTQAEISAMLIRVAQRSNKGPAESIGTIELVWPPRERGLIAATRPDTLTSWKRTFGEGLPTGLRLINSMLDKAHYTASGEAQRMQSVCQAWSDYVKALGQEAGWNAVFLVAPIPTAARAWVNAWAHAVRAAQSSAAAAEQERRKTYLLEQIRKTRQEKNFEEMVRLSEEFDELSSLPASKAKAPDVEDVRSLLRACTVSAFEVETCRHVALTPHHPLVLRLRGIADDVLADVIGTMWTAGWPEEALDDLDETFHRWGIPEPVHCYGFWSGEPLVFEGWLGGSRFGLFSKLGSGRDSDAGHIGVRDVVRTVERYIGLFPEAADRLRLRVQADRDGRWAWRIIDTLLDSFPQLRSDIDLVTTLSARESTAIERGVQESYERRRAFELGLEGTSPQIRVRRADQPVGPAHLSLVVGDEIDAFRSTLDALPAEIKVGAGTWDSTILFAEALPALHQYSFSVGDPLDELSQSVAAAVGFASHQVAVVFRERYAFDKTKCEAPLLRLQGNAHWLVLASRQPLYRAVQQAGRQVASLLDFYTSSERGRPVHVCASLSAQHARVDLIRLEAVLRSLLDDEAADLGAQAVVRAALGFAPGLAMRCAGAVTAIEVEGLLGLLLTGEALRKRDPAALILSLDQHHDLLASTGQLGDVISVKLADGAIRITVGESKFTTLPAGAEGTVGADARTQVDSTVRRLHHLSLQHPLSLSVRAKLARAIVHQIHLAGVDEHRAKELISLVTAARNPGVPIVIEPASTGSVYIWSVASQTADAHLTSDRAAEIILHGRSTTLARFKELVGTAAY
ncbi:hypothetical protein [Sorangium sp. So ce1335]|uniref:hypothetical protein n=1 Tax=Sorangium sp. So ce1335 TaxID=3133335 RepID=UPI003F622E55